MISVLQHLVISPFSKACIVLRENWRGISKFCAQFLFTLSVTVDLAYKKRMKVTLFTLDLVFSHSIQCIEI